MSKCDQLPSNINTVWLHLNESYNQSWAPFLWWLILCRNIYTDFTEQAQQVIPPNSLVYNQKQDLNFHPTPSPRETKHQYKDIHALLIHANGITLTHCTITLTMNIQQFCQNCPAQTSMWLPFMRTPAITQNPSSVFVLPFSFIIR